MPNDRSEHEPFIEIPAGAALQLRASSRCPVRAFAIVWPLLIAALIAASPCAARTWQVGPQRDLKNPSAAASAAKDGDTILIEQGEYADCAIWRANNLVIEGRGDVVIRDKVCEDKAIFVTKGTNITIRGIEFAHARSTNKIGAGIRGEGANLTIENSRFTDNENGILTGANPRSHIIVRGSVFTRNGKCDPDCTHGIYIGTIELLQVSNSVFLQQYVGHHIKSRALRTELVGNTIKDGPTGTASFAVDLPNGGALVMRGNVIEKGPQSENHLAAISIGEEGARNPAGELTIERNIFVNGNAASTAFVRNQTATPARLLGNKLTGKVVPLTGPGTVLP